MGKGLGPWTMDHGPGTRDQGLRIRNYEPGCPVARDKGVLGPGTRESWGQGT